MTIQSIFISKNKGKAKINLKQLSKIIDIGEYNHISFYKDDKDTFYMNFKYWIFSKNATILERTKFKYRKYFTISRKVFSDICDTFKVQGDNEFIMNLDCSMFEKESKIIVSGIRSRKEYNNDNIKNKLLAECHPNMQESRFPNLMHMYSYDKKSKNINGLFVCELNYNTRRLNIGYSRCNLKEDNFDFYTGLLLATKKAKEISEGKDYLDNNRFFRKQLKAFISICKDKYKELLDIGLFEFNFIDAEEFHKRYITLNKNIQLGKDQEITAIMDYKEMKKFNLLWPNVKEHKNI